jgi:Na+/pantothenate symporter
MLIAMASYMALVIFIGLYFAKRANESSSNFFLGGRTIGPWVTALSAEASDMSGWLLMGLPGVAYFFGLSDAIWTAIGLAAGTYVNWLLVAKRLRNYSVVSGDSITIPDFLSNRFKEKKKVIMIISALFILIFFTVYAASCFVTVGKLFSTLFGIKYQIMMIAGAVFVVAGIIGAVVLPIISDKLRVRVPLFIITILLLIPLYLGLTFVKSFLLISIIAGTAGFAIMGVAPILFQYGSEVAYPIQEGTSLGLILLMGQISGALFVYVFEALIGTSGSIVWPMLLIVGMTAIEVPFTLRMKESKVMNNTSQTTLN